MTCIVALEHQGKVWMGGDSAATSDWDVRSVIDPKVFKLGDFLIGYTDSFRMGQVLEFHARDFFKVVGPDNGDDDLAYIVGGFIPYIRDLFKTNGYANVENGVDTGGQFMIGYHGKIFEVGRSFQVLRMADRFNAIGAGFMYALGSMATTTSEPGYDPEYVIDEALRVAAHFTPSVRAPFTVLRQ